jgi:hypothetical protein
VNLSDIIFSWKSIQQLSSCCTHTNRKTIVNFKRLGSKHVHFTPQETPWYSFLLQLSGLQSYWMWTEGVDHLKISKTPPPQNRTQDLPFCVAQCLNQLCHHSPPSIIQSIKKYAGYINCFIWNNMEFLYMIRAYNTAVLTKWLAGFIFPAASSMLHTLESRTSSRTLAASRISRIKSATKQEA